VTALTDKGAARRTNRYRVWPNTAKPLVGRSSYNANHIVPGRRIEL